MSGHLWHTSTELGTQADFHTFSHRLIEGQCTQKVAEHAIVASIQESKLAELLLLNLDNAELKDPVIPSYKQIRGRRGTNGESDNAHYIP